MEAKAFTAAATFTLISKTKIIKQKRNNKVSYKIMNLKKQIIKIIKKQNK